MPRNYKNDTQKLKPPRRGERLTSDWQSHLVAAIHRYFVPGKGIRIKRMGDQAVISAEAVGGGGGGGDVVGKIWYEAESKAELPTVNVKQTALGRVTAGANKGMVCIRNPDNDGWHAINFWE